MSKRAAVARQGWRAMLCVLALVGIWATGCSRQAQPPAAGEDSAGTAITTLQEFNDKIGASAKPVVVDFHAEWCNPCKQMAPHLRALEEQYKGRVVFYSVDVDRAADVARQQDIRYMPTLKFFVGGKLWGEPVVGYQTPEQLKDLIEKLVSSTGAVPAQMAKK